MARYMCSEQQADTAPIDGTYERLDSSYSLASNFRYAILQMFLILAPVDLTEHCELHRHDKLVFVILAPWHLLRRSVCVLFQPIVQYFF